MISILALLTLTAQTNLTERIMLTPSMLINETAVGDATPLVDEQSSVGDPISGKGIPPQRPYFPTWTAWRYPVSVAVDLGSECQIGKIFLYNETGGGPMEIATGKPFEWDSKKVQVEGYKQWVEIPVDKKTRWLQITLTQPTSVPELIVYGKRLAPIPPAKPIIKRRPLPTMDQLVGTNAFIDDPIEKISTPGGFVREYHPSSWDFEGPDHKVRFQPSGAAGGNAWFFDDYYAKLKAAGVTVSPSIMGTPSWLYGDERSEHKPVAKGKDTQDPASYAWHAQHLFQYAARYGNTKVADSRLKLADGEPRKSGLNLLKYIENWNEPDKDWEGREGRFDPYDLAAMTSADYDGNQGRLGQDAGVKNADPSMKLVIGGLAGLDINILKAMKLWSDAKRGGSFPADVLNVHHYSSTAGEQGWKPDTKALSPEDDHLREKMEVFSDWRDQNVPDRELWLTEFGYDTNKGSPIYSYPIGKMTSMDVQGAWLIRGFLALAAARVDKAAMFMLRDTDSKSGGVFATCGIVGEKGNWDPKPGYFYMATLKNSLKGMRFGAEIPSGRPDVKIYRFDAVSGGGHGYAVWCPTSEDKHIASYQLKVPTKSAKLIQLVNGKLMGETKEVSAKNGGIELPVSETPSFVILK